MADIERLRSEIADIDGQIVELAARRGRIAERIGAVKDELGEPIRDYGIEKVVVDRARDIADAAGLSGDLAESLMLQLIRSSLEIQERGRVEASSAGTGRTAMVVGGGGQMGGWFVRFLRSQGYDVITADPEGGDVAGWCEGVSDLDLYVVATPLPVTGRILNQMSENPPSGLILDIGSLKTPLRHALDNLVGAGGNVSSIHPMFGPETRLLSGRHVVLVDLGVSAATLSARELFSSTMVSIVEMDLESHDRLIAYILGLSHALNIAFFTVLANSGETARAFAELSSTTFESQLAVASQVAFENPSLYFEIQHLNDYGDEPLAALSCAVQRIRVAVESGDAEGFAKLMSAGAAYFKETGLG